MTHIKSKLIRIDGKWVTDDYNEDEALSKCVENGFTPYATAYEDEIIANAVASMQPQGRPAQQGQTDQVQKPALTLAPFYTLGGPTTHFGGNGADPWSEAGLGNKRAKLRGQGVSEEDWMLRTAQDCRRIDRMLAEYREERLKVLEGVDATRGWVYAVEKETEKTEEDEGNLRPIRPEMERKRSGLPQEVTFEGMVLDEPPVPRQIDLLRSDNVDMEQIAGGKIVIQAPEEEDMGSGMWRWGLGEWKPGVIRAAYEVRREIFILQIGC